jgi:hypothetical protein
MYLKNDNAHTKIVASAKIGNKTQIRTIASTKINVSKCKVEEQHTKRNSNKHEKEHQ